MQVAGEAFQMAAPVLHAEWRRGGAVQRAPLRSLQALLTQVAQTAVCNQLHPLAQRLCRWLLCIHDRVPSAEVPMTHEGRAQLVGAHRESVTVVAGHLQAAGLIRAARGCITILDRPGLEARACECYLVDYGDGRALDVLAQTFDALPIREGDNPLANRVFIELRCTIEDLGGALTVAQQNKFAQADAARCRFVARLPWDLEAPAPPPWRNDLCAPLGSASWAGTPPCWCGSRKKYKKCHLPLEERA